MDFTAEILLDPAEGEVNNFGAIQTEQTTVIEWSFIIMSLLASHCFRLYNNSKESNSTKFNSVSGASSIRGDQSERLFLPWISIET